METKNNTLIVGLLTLILGLMLGYFAAASRFAPMAQMPMSGMHGAMHEMTRGLEGKTGDALDEAFLDNMVIHHQGAIEMARTLVKYTQRPELTMLGNDIIETQMQEIEIMRQWRKEWFNK